MNPRALAVPALVVLVAGAFVLRSPLHLATVEVELPALRPTGTLATAEAVLVASPDRVAARSAAGARDDTFAWVSFLEQEVGPWRLSEPGTLSTGGLVGARVVIVPDTAWGDLSAADLGALTDAATRGDAVVVVEGDATRAAGLCGRALAVPPFAHVLTSLQQGEIAPPGATYPGVAAGLVQPHGYRAAAAPGFEFEPSADVLEGELLARIEDAAPTAGWWRFPAGAPAYVAVTHDEEGFGDRSAWLPQALAERGVASSAFVETEAITPNGVVAMQEADSDVHLHWDRGFLGTMPLEDVKLAGFAPARRRPSLLEQKAEAIALDIDVAETVLNRTHGLVCDPDPARTFRMLHAAGIDVDSTYGPAGAGRFGYLFGTGLPFRPLDTTGWPFPLLEVPFVFQDDEEWSRADQDRIVREAAVTHHQLVVTVYHVNAMARLPSTERMDGLLAIGETADAVGATHGSLLPFLRHWQARLVSPLRTSEADGVLRVEVDARIDGMSVRLPARAGARVVVDGAPAAALVRGRHLVVPVAAGRHVVEVRAP